jgi:hypothetical protein
VIELTPDKARIFRITHMANVPWMLDHGLRCRNSALVDPQYHEIGNPDLIGKRQHRPVPIPPGGSLSDYIPFYFTPFSPMLYNITTGYQGIRRRPMSEIVILVSSLHRIAGQGLAFVFSDRHAYLQAAVFSSNLAELVALDWKRLRARDFKRDPNDLSRFERYQAEALIHKHLPVEGLDGIVCHGGEQAATLNAEIASRNLQLPVVTRPGWYF